MKTISKDDIIKSLSDVGLENSQVVYLQSDLSKPGRIEGVKNREEFCKFFFDAIFCVIGDEGTLVVPTFTTQVAKFDIDFVWEETPSLTGIFPEFIRSYIGSLRSTHPIHSLCAIGKEKNIICSNNGTNNYGWDSPFHRMLLKKAKILTIGLEIGYSVGIVHHLEAACCLPYVYNKLLKWSPIINGKIDKRIYFSTVRYLYLDWEGYDLTRYVKELQAIDGIKSVPLGGSWVHMTDYEQVFLEGCRILKDNPFFLLRKPPEFQYGKIPFDGPTSEEDQVTSQKDIDNAKSTNWMGYYLAKKLPVGGGQGENNP